MKLWKTSEGSELDAHRRVHLEHETSEHKHSLYLDQIARFAIRLTDVFRFEVLRGVGGGSCAVRFFFLLFLLVS